MRTEADYLRDALAFSSKRRVLFVKLYQRIGSLLGFAQISEEVVVQALEHIHASATILDDMLDNEYLRKDIPTYYMRHGHSVAAFAALNLMMKGIELVSENTPNVKGVLEIIRRMIDAEEADVGLKKRDATMSPLAWYRDVVSKKIAGELLLILLLCSEGSDDSNGRLPELERLTCLLGQFIQYCDDWYDVLVKDPLATNTDEAGYVLTYSLPLALYLSTVDDEMETFVGTKIDRVSAKRIIERISLPSNRSRVEQFIQAAYHDLLKSLRTSSIPGRADLAEIAIALKTEAYWEKKYYEPA